jgi:hypothetical protein
VNRQNRDGYITEADAEMAVASRQKREPALDWRVEPMASGKYRLAGYPAAAEDSPASASPPAAATTTPGSPVGAAEGAVPQAGEWSAFPPESGTLGVPRAEMPQVKAEARFASRASSALGVSPSLSRGLLRCGAKATRCRAECRAGLHQQVP